MSVSYSFFHIFLTKIIIIIIIIIIIRCKITRFDKLSVKIETFQSLWTKMDFCIIQRLKMIFFAYFKQNNDGKDLNETIEKFK